MVKIRLRRVGAKKQPSYRVVVADSRSPRDGRFIETIGHYNPRTHPPTVVIYEDRAIYWLSVGAQPSDAVARFFQQLGLGEKVKQVQGGADVADVAAPRPGRAPAKEAVVEAEAPKAKPARAKAAAKATEPAEPAEPAEEAAAVEEPATEVEAPAAAAAAETVTEEPAEAEAAAEVEAEAPAAAAEPEPATETAEAAGDLAGLGLSTRVQAALEAAGVTTVEALATLAEGGEAALTALPGIGAKAAAEIRDKLAGR